MTGSDADAAPEPEFSAPLPVAALDGGPVRRTLEADAAARKRLARRFDAPAIEALSGEVLLERDGRDVVAMGHVRGTVERTCVVTLEPMIETIASPFRVRFVRDLDAAPVEDDLDVEPLTGDAIDLGELLAQQASLALAPHPRKPGASVDAARLRDPSDAGAFAGLADLAKPTSRGDA